MTRNERESLRELYNEACYGAGAETRREARRLLEMLLRQAKVSLKDAFDAERLDLRAYFASRPI